MNRNQIIRARIDAQSLVEDLSERLAFCRDSVSVSPIIVTGIEGNVEEAFRRLGKALGFRVEAIGREAGEDTREERTAA